MQTESAVNFYFENLWKQKRCSKIKVIIL